MVTEIFLLKLEIRSHKIEENSIGALPFFYKQLPQVLKPRLGFQVQWASNPLGTWGSVTI